jgi:hypothetical protein
MLNNSSRVVLEPKLEAMAALWSPAKRLEMANLFSRWARQLRVSSFIMTTDARGRVFPRPRLPKISRRRAALN